MTPNIEQTIRHYMADIRHMSLGTTNPDGSPYVAELDFVIRQDDLALCFRSLASRNHSRNIARDGRVFGTIVRQHAFGEEPAEGVAFAGTAALLGAGAEQDQFAELFIARLGANNTIVTQAAKPQGSQFYKIDVTTWRYRGAPEGGKPQTYVLPWGAAA